MLKKFPFKIIDLTHTLDSKTPSWDTTCGFESCITLDYHDCEENTKFRVQSIKMHAGIGTHIDSPSHCNIDEITTVFLSLDSLIAPLCVIDVSKKMTESYKVSINDINDFENKYGQIQEGDFVCIFTGWSKYWSKPEKYHNNYLFPSVSKEAASFLISRKIVGLGIDTLSPDLPSTDYPVHRIVLGAKKYIVENIASINQMPKTGAFILILPMKASGLTEAPVRAVGLISK